MQRTQENKPENIEPGTRSRPNSRKNSATLSRRSLTGDKETKSPLHSAKSTPKKQPKPLENQLDFMVTGKQILKRSDRANSLPGARRQSVGAIASKTKVDSPKRPIEHTKSQETSLEDDMTLDLSQMSDFEDTCSNHGYTKFQALATSTPNQPQTNSLHRHIHSRKMERSPKSAEGSNEDQQSSRSFDSFRSSSTESPHRYPTDLDYSASPAYSSQSSSELTASPASQLVSPRSQDPSSCCVSSWQGSFDRTKVEDLPPRTGGEWSEFWANYNYSLAKVPMKGYYDQCPTPYRTENFDLADFEFSDVSRKRSPEDIQAINNIICNEGLDLTPRETQQLIKCAHLLGNVLTKAIERKAKSQNDKEPQIEKKKNLTLDLKETSIPVVVKEEKRWETVTTQTDISLPNTKTAPKIFENILRQLSRSSIDVEKVENKKVEDKS